MKNIIIILTFTTVAVAVILTAISQQRTRRSRVSDLRDLAARLGFESFNPNRDDNFAMGWGFLSRLAQGTDRYAFNILRGMYQGQSLFIFDYHYQTGSGKNVRDYNLTILMLVCQQAFSHIAIVPENLLKKIAAVFDSEDIRFESAEFSRTYCVRSPDKKFAYDVCNARMMEYLLANRGLHIEIQGPALLLAFDTQLPVEKIEFNLQRLAQIRSLLPEYLFTNTA